MNQLQVFDFENHNIRTVAIDKEPYFIGNDVAKVLGYSNYRNAVGNHVDVEDKMSTQIEYAGQKRSMTLINESGLYSLIFGSKLESAKRFKRWVTSEVLPTLRKTGTYEITTDPLKLMKLGMQAIEKTNEDVKGLKNDVTYLKDEVKLDAGEYDYLSRQVKSKVREALNVYGYVETSEVKKALFKDINQGVNEVCGVRTRTQMKQKHFNRAMEYVNAWVPSTATRMKVQQLTMNFTEGESNA